MVGNDFIELTAANVACSHSPQKHYSQCFNASRVIGVFVHTNVSQQNHESYVLGVALSMLI